MISVNTSVDIKYQWRRSHGQTKVCNIFADINTYRQVFKQAFVTSRFFYGIVERVRSVNCSRTLLDWVLILKVIMPCNKKEVWQCETSPKRVSYVLNMIYEMINIVQST